MNPFPAVSWTNTVQVGDDITLQAEIDAAHATSNNTKIEIKNDIALKAPLNVPEGTVIFLTSADGGTFAIDAGTQGFRVMNVATFTNAPTRVHFGNIRIIRGMGVPDGGAISGTGGGNALIVLETGADFRDNAASNNGGAIALEKGAVCIADASLIRNRAEQNGGAIYIAQGYGGIYEALYMEGRETSLIAENEAGIDGGGAYINGGAVIDGGIITKNHSNSRGGGLYLRKLTMNGGTIGSNVSDTTGGGVYLEGQGLIGGSAQFNGNIASVGGGGIYLGRGGSSSLNITDDARFVGNQALGALGGGAIYVLRQQFPVLVIDSKVYFERNTAPTGYSTRLPIDDPVYQSNIHVPDSMWSSPYTLQGYNNFDIAYNLNAPEPGTGCEAEGHQMIDVCLPVSVSPYANVGVITSRCCGVAVITPGADACEGIPGGNCDFTIRQRVCVNVPVEFGALVAPGEPHIQCTDEDCSGCEPPAP